jgi:hypothetical protein
MGLKDRRHDARIVRQASLTIYWQDVVEMASLLPFGQVSDTYIWVLDHPIHPFPFSILNCHL